MKFQISKRWIQNKARDELALAESGMTIEAGAVAPTCPKCGESYAMDLA